LHELIVYDINHFMTTRINNDALPRIHHSGPPLLLPAVVYSVLVIAGAVTLGSTLAAPHDAAHQAAAYVASIETKLRWGSFFEFGSSIPLLIFVATTVSRLRFLRVRAAGEVMALSGGLAAAAMLMLSALSGWSLTRPGVADTDSTVRALQALSFAGGGPGFVVPYGIFIAGVSITAGLYRLIPRWLMILGLVVAAACELASLTLIVWNAAYFIPVGRFLGIFWMIAVALTLPTTISADPVS
jgi:hypothetical protein